MLSNTILATAVLASASVAYAGSAIVVNACQYPVKLCNTPSTGGGYTEIDKSLESNETYTQEWTELSNGNGWSIKLSPTDSLDHILQYEYTFHNDGIIWYDLSEVDGNPWDGNWEIVADKATCTPKQQAYRYATDDAYGMQSCPDDTTITVTLCSGEDQNDGAAASVSSSVAAVSATQSYAASSSTVQSTVEASTTSASAYSTATLESASPTSVAESATVTSEVQATSTSSHHKWWTQGKVVVQATTLATSAAVTSTNNNGAVVTNVVTEIETAYVTATAYAKREAPHVHHHGHPHYRA